MAIGIGAKEVKIAIGNIEIAKISLGDTLVYSAGSTVTYYVNNTTMYTEEVDSGASCLSPTTFTPELSGWTFVGWREDSTASGNVLSDKVMGDEPVTLYAVFSKTITLSYNGNGAGSGSVAAQQGYVYSCPGFSQVNPTFTLSANGFTRSSCTFQKWAIGSASGTQYAVGSSVTLSSNTTFYAVWKVTVTTATLINTNPYRNDIYPSSAELIRFSNGIDASLYKGIQLRVGTCRGSVKHADCVMRFGIMTKTTTNTSNSNYSNTIVFGYADYEDEIFYHNHSTVTMNFTQTSGILYLFAGVTYHNGGSGKASWSIEFDSSTITLIPRF